MGWYDLVVRVVVAGVLVGAAGGKLRERRGFEDGLRVGPLGRWAAPLAVGVPVVEVVTAAGLVTGAPYPALVTAALLFAGFVGYLALEHRAGATTCACLGARRTPHRVMIALDLTLLAALLPLLAAPGLDRFGTPGVWGAVAVAVLLAAALLRPRRGGGRHTPGAPAVTLPGPARRSAPDTVPPGLVVFTATDCPPCGRLQPRLAAAGAVLVDVDRQPAVADRWGVTATPSAFLVDEHGSTTVRPAIGEEAVERLLSGSR